jgi:hypothetical protein
MNLIYAKFLQSAQSIEDFPTFDLPKKATSATDGGGESSIL